MLSLVDIVSRIEAGTLSPDTAIRLSLDAIAAQEGEVGAFVCHDDALKARIAGPLRGIAVGVKDIIDTAAFPTEMGSSIYAGWRPRANAPIVTALERAGASIIGKTTTTAFAYSDPTATRNPRNLDHTPGGSSSGSAAAVAAGFVPLAIGTQTAGSVIRPASYCGVAAIKPSYRLLPIVGFKCYSWTLDTVGLFAAGVSDVAYALATITNRPELSLRKPGRPRIGLVTQDFAGPPEPAGGLALDRAAHMAEKAGAAVRDVALPEIFTQAYHCHPLIASFDAREALAWEYAEHRDALPPLLRANLDSSRSIAPSDYDEALGTAHRARRALNTVFAEVDVLMTLSAPGPAPRGLASTGSPRFNRLWTLMGIPCVNVTADIAAGGLPVGIQIIAPSGEDAKALSAARFVEQAFDLP